MKTLVIYYSYTGNTKRLAERLSQETQVDLYELKDRKRPGKVKVCVAGCIAALRMKHWPVAPIEADLHAYEKIIIMAPVWAGHPVPQINTVLDMLAAGTTVEVIMVSQSGSSAAKEKIEAILSQKHCKLSGYQNVKA